MHPPGGRGPNHTWILPSPAPFPKFCPCCGAGMERYCLKCHKKAEMFFEEWWPEEGECVRTYGPAKRCSRCNALLEEPVAGPGDVQ